MRRLRQSVQPARLLGRLSERNGSKQWRSRFLKAIAVFLGIVVGLMLVLAETLYAPAEPKPTANNTATPPAIEQALSRLPLPRPHPLPSTLAQQPPRPGGDYFDQVQAPIVGALVWSRFPVTVYVQPITETEQASPFLLKRSQIWIGAVQTAIAEWSPWIPLQIVDQPKAADITLTRSPLPLKLEPAKPGTGDRRLPIPRARSAETRFEFYVTSPNAADQPSLLAHRMVISIRPDQASDYLQAAARHELGHALGIWGHSPNQTDAMYFSQVRHPATISARDINTLRKVYEQPTRLGWPMPSTTAP